MYNRKTQYQKFGYSVNYLEQQNYLPAFKEVWTEYKPLGSHALQATLKRVDFAFVRFFKGFGGYPKFKASRRYAGLNRSILDVAMAMIGKMLDYKLAEAGGFYVESPTRKLKPTQRCAKCWELTPKSLSDRVHVCSNLQCGHTEDRDVNAAQVNITWARGQELSSLDAESPSSTTCGRQAATRDVEASETLAWAKQPGVVHLIKCRRIR